MSIRTYALINATDVSNVDFSQVLETSTDTLKYSLDGSLTFIKWDTTNSQTPPNFIANGSISPIQTCTHKQILSILRTDVWTQSE